MKVSRYVKMRVTDLAIKSEKLRFFGFQVVPLNNSNIFNPRKQAWRLNLSNSDFLASRLSHLREEISCKTVVRKLEYCLCGSTQFPCKSRYGQITNIIEYHLIYFRRPVAAKSNLYEWPGWGLMKLATTNTWNNLGWTLIDLIDRSKYSKMCKEREPKDSNLTLEKWIKPIIGEH